MTAYAKDVRQFVTTYGGTIPCSAEELIGYIRLLARRVAPATIARRVMAIRDAHVRAGLALPTDDSRIREALRLLATGKLPLNLMTDFKGAPAPVSKYPNREHGAALCCFSHFTYCVRVGAGLGGITVES